MNRLFLMIIAVMVCGATFTGCTGISYVVEQIEAFFSNRVKYGNTKDEVLTFDFKQTADSVLVFTENSQWRGEQRDGMYNETGLLKKWREGGPELLWSFEGLGDGYTSAAVANGRIYITGLIGDKLFLFVLDLAGVLLAKKEIDVERNDAYPGPWA